MGFAGDDDIRAATAELARRLPSALLPLAGAAYDYRWSWIADGAAIFEAIQPAVWQQCGHNPVLLLTEVTAAELERAAADRSLVGRVEVFAAALAADARRPTRRIEGLPDGPVAFMCAEFGVHSSLPIYSGGLGVLAGDILKEASDLAVPMVGVGLLYRNGYFHQRLDASGQQLEYWIDAQPRQLPCVYVTGADGTPIVVEVPIGDENLVVRVWRTDVGRVPLYLLDTDHPANSAVGRWTTARLYDSNRQVRLAQYGVLGLGAVRALEAMGITPSVYHLNEGHASLAAFEVIRRNLAHGMDHDEAMAAARQQIVFTTHTPVAAGNETYGREEVLQALGRIAEEFGDHDRFLRLGRIHPGDDGESSGLTPLALRMARSANGVSQRHGAVARAMWQPLFGSAGVDDVPITHVTNGVHVPTWLGEPMRALLDRHLGSGWIGRAAEPATWAPVDAIPDSELWAARVASRRHLIEMVEQRAVTDRLRRGESRSYAEAAVRFDPDLLTIGFARRLATYKRLYLLGIDATRALRLLVSDHPVQFVFSGKAHPADDGAKQVVRQLFELKGNPMVSDRVAFLEDYDLTIAAELVAGCDVWVNLPRPPLEASGTSGMKAALNGGLNLSVLDGWWAEAHDGTNGWAIDGRIDDDNAAEDTRDAAQLFDILESEVVPMFAERDDRGVPVRWLTMIRNSLKTNGPRFSASRMLDDYVSRIYPPR